MTFPDENKRFEAPIQGILVEARQDDAGQGYFCAFLVAETDENQRPLPHATTSTSRKGVAVAVRNLCKRLQKRRDLFLPSLPLRWQIYLLTVAHGPVPLLARGYLQVTYLEEAGLFAADNMAVPTFVTNEQEAADYLERGYLNSYMEATGQTHFGALANLCQQLHAYGFTQTIDSLVLDSLTAGFFWQAALTQEGDDPDAPHS